MKLRDLKQAVNAIVRQAAPDIPIVDADLMELIHRPSFKTFVDSGSCGKYNPDSISRTIYIDIYFFATDSQRPRLENMDIQDALTYAFADGIPVENTVIPVLEDVDFSTEDGVLHAELIIEVTETVSLDDDEDGETMEHLEMEGLHGGFNA